MIDSRATTRPPLWLAASAVATGWAAPISVTNLATLNAELTAQPLAGEELKEADVPYMLSLFLAQDRSVKGSVLLKR